MEIKEPYGFIYITTNMVNGKRYIGQKKFRKDWKYYLGSGKALKRAIQKYGRTNFKRDIVAVGYSNYELDKLETEWINNYNAIESVDFYNIAEGGNGNSLAGKNEDEIEKIKEAMSKRVAGSKNPMYGMKGKDSPASKKIVCLNTGEVFESLTEASEKYNLDVSSIAKCCKGKIHSSRKLVWRYLEDYNKMNLVDISKLLYRASEGISGGYNPNAISVICLNDNKIFKCTKETAKYYNISVDMVRKICKGIYKQCKGYKFMYYDEYKNLKLLNV